MSIKGSIKLAQLTVEFGVRKFIHISSGGVVYGEPVYLPCDEDHPVRPLCPYGASKYTFELYLYMFKELYNLDYSVIRYPNVYGPRQDPAGEAGVVAIFIGRMLKNKPVTVNGSGEQVRDFVYVGDCARANLMTLENGSGGTYNLGFGIGTTVNQIFDNFKAITDFGQDATHGPAKPGETFRIYLDASRAKNELGWEPTVDLEQGLRKTVMETGATPILRVSPCVQDQGQVAQTAPNLILEPNAELRAEIVVVGSGPGGAITACLLAEAGRDDDVDRGGTIPATGFLLTVFQGGDAAKVSPWRTDGSDGQKQNRLRRRLLCGRRK